MLMRSADLWACGGVADSFRYCSLWVLESIEEFSVREEAVNMGFVIDHGDERFLCGTHM